MISSLLRNQIGLCASLGICLFLSGCGKDKPTQPPLQTPSIVGAWEWLGTSRPRDIFTYFSEDGRFYSIEWESGDQYGDNGTGVYTCSPPSAITLDYYGGWPTRVGTYSFHQNGEMLHLDFPTCGSIEMVRVSDAPDPGPIVKTYFVWGGDSRWPQIPIDQDPSFEYLGGSNRTRTFQTRGHSYLVIYVYAGDRVGLDAVETSAGYVGDPHTDIYSWNFGLRENIAGAPDGLYDVLGDGQHVAAFGILAYVETITPHIIAVTE